MSLSAIQVIKHGEPGDRFIASDRLYPVYVEILEGGDWVIEFDGRKRELSVNTVRSWIRGGQMFDKVESVETVVREAIRTAAYDYYDDNLSIDKVEEEAFKKIQPYLKEEK